MQRGRRRRAGKFAGVEEFVAAGDQRHERPPADRKRPQAERCRDAQPRRGQHVARPQHHDTCSHVVPASRHVIVGRGRLHEPHAIAEAQPTSESGHLAVDGFGPAKLEKYGAEILELTRRG